MQGRFPWLAVATVAGAALAGCGGGDEPAASRSDTNASAPSSNDSAATSPPSTAPSTSAAPSPAGAVTPATACDLLTSKEVGAAAKAQPTEHSPDARPDPGTSRCTWYDKPGASRRVLAKVYVVGPPAKDADAVYTRFRAADGLDDPPPKVGDRAYWGASSADQGPVLGLMHAGRFVEVWVANLSGSEILGETETADYKRRTEPLARAAISRS